MASFTLTLEEAINFSGGHVDFTTGIAKIVPNVAGVPVSIGLEKYPIHDETYRDTLNGKIVDHYLNREIGRETLSDFRRALRMRMNEIMPAYVALYKSTQIEFDPLSTIDMKTVSTSDGLTNTTTHGTNETATDSKSAARSVNSDTPQVVLTPDGDYATALADVNSDTTGTSNVTEDQTASVDSNQSGNTSITGYQGLASDLIMRYRESIINIDRMIIHDIEDLFMMVWDTPDNYTHYNAGLPVAGSYGYGYGTFF